MTVGKQFEKNFAMICFLLSPSGGKRKTHFSLQNSERPFCLPTVTHSPPVSAIMALNIMYRQKKTDGNRPRLPSVSVAFLCILHNPLFMIRVVGLCNMLKLTIFQRKSQNIIDIYKKSPMRRIIPPDIILRMGLKNYLFLFFKYSRPTYRRIRTQVTASVLNRITEARGMAPSSFLPKEASLP